MSSSIESKSASSFSHANEDHFEPYRAISRAAVGALIFSLMGALGLLFPVMLMLPALAGVLGLVAIANLRRYPNELTGWIPAVMGLLLGVGLLVGGIARHSYIYATEVPDGYQRINFSILQPSSRTPGERVPQEAIELDEEKIFVKGYMHPGVAEMGEVKQFILVPDMGTCCFGGQPALTDMIEVTLEGPLTIRYGRRKRKLAGKFKVDDELKPVTGLGGVYYQLSADYLK